MIDGWITIYWLTSIILLIVIATTRNAVSVSAIFGLGLIAYSFPLYTGEIEFRTSYLHNQIYTGVPMPSVYGIFILGQVFCLIALLLEGKLKRKIIKKRTVNISGALLLIHVISFFYVLKFSDLVRISAYPFSIEIAEKQEVNFDVMYYVLSISAVLILIDCAWRKSFGKIAIVPIIFLMLDLAMGFRNNFFLGIISVTLCYFAQTANSISLSNRIKLLAMGFFVLIAAFIYKPIYYALQFGGFDYMVEYMQRSEIMNIFAESESSAQIGIINEIIKSEISISPTDGFGEVFQFFPFSESVLGIPKYSTNSMIQNNLFPECEWGLASSAFGSLWILGQWFAIIAYLFFTVLFCIWKPRAHIASIVYFFMVPYIVFYVHRNDWYASIGTLKLVFIVLLLAFAVRPLVAAIKAMYTHSYLP